MNHYRVFQTQCEWQVELRQRPAVYWNLTWGQHWASGYPTRGCRYAAKEYRKWRPGTGDIHLRNFASNSRRCCYSWHGDLRVCVPITYPESNWRPCWVCQHYKPALPYRAYSSLQADSSSQPCGLCQLAGHSCRRQSGVRWTRESWRSSPGGDLCPAPTSAATTQRSWQPKWPPTFNPGWDLQSCAGKWRPAATRSC